MDKLISITITAEAVAWWGAIVATVLAVLRVAELLRDRVNVAVTYQTGMELIGPGQPSDDKNYLVLTVVNKGRRPVTITTVAGIPKSKRDKTFILLDSIREGPRELLEGKSTKYMVPEQDLDLAKLKYFAAYDMTGREYRCKVRA